jgi:hypothetical protein
VSAEAADPPYGARYDPARVARASGQPGRRRAIPAIFLLIALVAAWAISGALSPDAQAAPKPKPGAYAGHLTKDNGNVSNKEWLRFKVSRKGKVLTGYRSRLWVVCYSYPNDYSRLPVKFKAPKARIKGGKVSRRWTRNYTVEGERYKLTGLLKLRFRKRGRFRGKISLDFGSCATKTGDFPYFVPLKGKRRR